MFILIIFDVLFVRLNKIHIFEKNYCMDNTNCTDEFLEFVWTYTTTQKKEQLIKDFQILKDFETINDLKVIAEKNNCSYDVVWRVVNNCRLNREKSTIIAKFEAEFFN